MDDRRPDHSEDPRGRDVGSGYPEEAPGGANPGEERSRDGDAPDRPAPRTRSPDDAGVEGATGTPRNAG